MTYAHGFDASDNNGELDFAAYPGMDFAFFKACELTPAGMHYDAQFARSMAGSLAHYGKSFARFAYGFAHPGEAVEPQASALVQLGNDHGMLIGDHFMMDLEVTDGLPAAEVAAFGAAFCHRVNVLSKGRRCLDYTFVSFAQAGNCEGQWPWRLFIADWDVSQPLVPDPWAGRRLPWSFWQFAPGETRQARSRSVQFPRPDGMAPPTPDLDVFHGDRAALMDFCEMPANRR